jgi:hypothetical protein
MSSIIVKALLFRNSQTSRRPIYISDSKDTKEWPCFLCQFYFMHLFAQLRQKKHEANKQAHLQQYEQNTHISPPKKFTTLPLLIPIKNYHFLWIVKAQQKQLLPRNLAQSFHSMLVFMSILNNKSCSSTNSVHEGKKLKRNKQKQI